MSRKQKSGLYRTKVKIGVDKNGKDIVKYISGKTKRELEQARQNVIVYYIHGEGVAEDRLFGSYAEEWFKLRKLPGLSASSAESYRTALNKHILPEFGKRKLRAIMPADLQAFVNQFSGFSQTKITYIIASLRGIFSAACADRILLRNPMDHINKPQAASPEEKRALTPEERKAIENTCANHAHGAYLAAMYYLGCRPGEARGLMWGDFDWKACLVHIQRDIDYKAGCKAGALKNYSSNRLVPVPDPLIEILKPLAGAPDAYLFSGKSGGALAKTTAERMWTELMVACEMATPLEKGANRYRECDIRAHYSPIITPHSLRHNYITLCWESGIDVYTTMRLVGHKSIKTTMDIYTHLSNQQMKKAIIQVGNMFSTNSKK